MATNWRWHADMFKALGIESRIKIIEHLKREGPLGVNELSEILGITPSAVSQHLKILKFFGLVNNERKGYWVYYDVDSNALERCGEMLSNFCCCDCLKSDDGTKNEENRDRHEILKKYEKELERELESVRARIDDIKEK